MALEQLYQQLILEHNRKPRNFGPLPDATHAGSAQDALCGDDIRVELRVKNGAIEAAGFSGDACAVTRASASLLTDWLEGRALADLEDWFRCFSALLQPGETCATEPELADLNHLRAVARFPTRVRNALLPWQAVLNATRQT